MCVCIHTGGVSTNCSGLADTQPDLAVNAWGNVRVFTRALTSMPMYMCVYIMYIYECACVCLCLCVCVCVCVCDWCVCECVYIPRLLCVYTTCTWYVIYIGVLKYRRTYRRPGWYP